MTQQSVASLLDVDPGAKGQSDWRQRLGSILTRISQQILDLQAGASSGYTGTITTAALTSLGSQGSMTFVNGKVTAQTPAT